MIQPTLVVDLQGSKGMEPPTATDAPSTDYPLVAAVARGDRHALRQLYDRYGSTLFAVAYRILDDRADAEDIVVEAFTQAWQQASRFEQNRGSVVAWLSTMTRSRALDLVRARRRRDRLAEEASREVAVGRPTAGVRDDPATSADLDDQRRHVHRALESLPTDQRTAIELAYFEGLSQSEIAARLDEPLGTIKTRIRSGMAKLRDSLRPLYQDLLNE